MTNNLPLPLSTTNENDENLNKTDHHSMIHETNPAISISQNHEQQPSSPYLMLPVGDNQHSSLPDFQDPLFYHQPLHFHYNQSIPFMIGSEHERGDRVRFMNDIKSNEYRKQKSLASSKYQIEKSKSKHQRYVNSKKSKNKIKKSKEKKKKASKGNMNIRKHKTKTNNRSSSQQLRYQSKTRHALLLKHRRQKQILLKKKKQLLKQRSTSKRRSMNKVYKNKSVTSNKHIRKLNATNNRVPSTVSSRRSLTLPVTRAHSITQSRIEPIESKKIKHRTDVPTLDPILQSTSKQMMNVTKQSPLLLTNKLSSSCTRPLLSLKSSVYTKLDKKLSRKNLSQSRLNVRKFSASKYKQIKKRNHGKTKLNIRSSTHTTFKKNVRRYRKRRSARCKTKFPQCTSKTLITIAPIKRSDQNVIKSVKMNNDNNSMKTSPSLFSLKKILTDKQSLTSTVMPLAKNTAQLTSKNNNKRTLKTKRRRNRTISIISQRKLKEPTKREMTLRSRTIIINNINSTKRKGGK